MTNRSICLFSFLLMAASAGCGDRRPPGVDRDASQARRMLALAPSEGPGAVDRALSAARAQAEASGAPAESWVVLAQAWIRKGRTTSDPGFLLSAEAAADEALALSPG